MTGIIIALYADDWFLYIGKVLCYTGKNEGQK